MNVDDFKEILNGLNHHLSKRVDLWLESEVAPSFKYEGQGYDVPAWITSGDLRMILRAKGFYPTFHSSYQGTFVYIYTRDTEGG